MSGKACPGDLYISLQGDDSLPGTSPDRSGNDGPLRTIERALYILRMRKIKGKQSGPATVWLRGGRYQLRQPLKILPRDSGPVTFAAMPGDKPVISGGVALENWQETRINTTRAWVADVSAVLEKFGPFRQLFVNDIRCKRPRLPKSGYYTINKIPSTSHGSTKNGVRDRFICEPGQIQNWKNLQDAEIVVLHYWVDDRLPIESFDEKSCMVICSKTSRMSLVDAFGSGNSRYYIENVREALSCPGEWYLDREEQRLYYIPREGETVDTSEAIVSVVPQLIKIQGDANSGHYVEFLTFRGLHFAHTDWVRPYVTRQAAPDVPGVVSLEAAQNCTIEKCTFEHIGWYGIDIKDGCRGTRVIGNTIRDMGGGGIKVNGSPAWGPRSHRTSGTVIIDNHIHDGGMVYYASSGIVLMHTFGNTVAHNHIHDLYYTGISLGWVWGYWPSVSRDNLVEKNHIHDLGKGVINDMGGIYTLGIQPGTVLRGNLIHDIDKHSYGGWAIYPDEGSSYLVIENNICYNVSSQPFHLHFGRENILRNNIWAFGKEGIIAISRGTGLRWEEKGAFADGRGAKSFTFERNIVVTDNQPLFVGGMDDPTGGLETKSFISDLNLFWDTGGRDVYSLNAGHGAAGKEGAARLFEWSEWNKLGYDIHSRIADPKFTDVDKGDFRPADDSPALEMGFIPIDMSDVGVRNTDRGGECG
ncbi:MAG: hypothetical protein GF350_17380 [Chitinivibrionales bacterium]|nr:hypothetical protein [Chitinivibrionales bacterium]